MKLVKRHGFYHYRFMVRGKIYRGSTELKVLKDAVTAAGEIRKQVVFGNLSIFDRGPAPELKDFLERSFMPFAEKRHKDKPKTLEYYKYGSLQLSNSKIARSRLDEITDRDVAEFIEEHHEFAAASINQGLRTLRRVLRLAYEWHRIARRPTIKLVEGERQRERVLTPDEEKKYLEKCTEPWKTMATISIELGLRPGEIVKLKEDDVSWSQLTLAVTSGKSKAAKRTLPLTDAVYSSIKTWLMQRGLSGNSVWLFPSPKNKARHYSQHNIFDWHHAALKASGVDEFEPYSLRHTALTRIAKHVRNPYALAKIAGHSSITITQRYIHPEKEEIWSAFEEKTGLKIGHAQRREQLKVVSGKDEDAAND